MTPRRPSTAPNDAAPPRMPFASAEALLWWPELRKQHAWLLTEMRALQTQHDAYNTRIQTTEAAAEAAEAATSRIRHMEQQIQAIEAVDKDKAFEEWAAAEIMQLRNFVERNGMVRVKQIELEKEVQSAQEGVEGLKDVPVELRALLRRVEGLEKGKRMDERKIEVLEKEIGESRAGQRNEGVKNGSSAAELNDGWTFRKTKIPSRLQDADDLNDTTETEDEGPVRPHKSSNQQIQVPQIPLDELVIPEDEPGGLSTRAPPVTSARQRLFKRLSIHNSKLPKILEEIPSAAAAAKTQTRRTAVPLPTRPVNKTNPSKRKEPEPEIYTERITRSQLKNQEQSASLTDKSKPIKKLAVEPTVIKRKKPNAAPEVAQDIIQTSQPVSGRLREQRKPNDIPGPSHLPEATQLVTASPSKRRKLNVAPPSRTAQMHDGDDNENRPLQYAQNILKLPRKAASKPSACITCRQRHRACDRGRPVCGECSKSSVSCHYPDPPSQATQVAKSKQSSPRKKPAQQTATAAPTRSGAKTGTEQGLSSRTVSPEKPKASAGTKTLSSTADKPASAGPRRRAMPVITDYETFLRMRAEDKIP